MASVSCRVADSSWVFWQNLSHRATGSTEARALTFDILISHANVAIVLNQSIVQYQQHFSTMGTMLVSLNTMFLLVQKIPAGGWRLSLCLRGDVPTIYDGAIKNPQKQTVDFVCAFACV